jgi:Na+/melibiose symporter-like transporter
MSTEAAIVMAGAVALMVSTVVLVRRRLLSIRYGLGWLTVSLVGFLGTPLLSLAASGVRHLGFTPTGFSLGVLIGFLGLICLQLSISLSGLHRAIQDLSEHAALVEQRLRELESHGEEHERSHGEEEHQVSLHPGGWAR